MPLEIAENRTVSATLGNDSVMASLRAGIIGFCAVTLFMLVYYRLPGFLADCALILYAVLLMALLIAVGVTLTLPGIAGLIISVGVAVDANVLIFERLKEELWQGKGMRTALEAGFHRAWTAILDFARDDADRQRGAVPAGRRVDQDLRRDPVPGRADVAVHRGRSDAVAAGHRGLDGPGTACQPVRSRCVEDHRTADGNPGCQVGK